MMFNDIIQCQMSQKHKYINKIIGVPGGITIIIKNNKIDNIIDGPGWVHPTRKRQYTNLITNVLSRHNVKDIIVNINLVDHPMNGVFNFCRKKGQYEQFLLPNHRFTNDDIEINKKTFDNYSQQSNYILNLNSSIPNKINKVYTNCIPHASKIAYLKYAYEHQDICNAYAYIGSGHKLVRLSQETADKLMICNMAGTDIMPWEEHLKYKYVLYNDGNTLSDRMRLLLCSNSVIIKQKSSYEEFYSYRLINGENYIEYNDINEIESIVKDLNNNDILCNNIINNNNNFIENELTYDNILLYCCNLFNGLV